VTEAVKAALPAGILAQFVHRGTARSGQGATGSGAKRKGNRRGRRLPSRPGRPDGQHRIDLIGTLRAAAPWQPLRRRTAVVERRVHIRTSDIRLRRFQEATDRLIVFTVDASGSAALARLAEAKGAVELMLGEAYARRDHVALIAFRGTEAELLLPPTRSLVRTKRALTALPGGGGTPLAAGLQAAMAGGADGARAWPVAGHRDPHRWAGEYRARRPAGPQAGRRGRPQDGPGPGRHRLPIACHRHVRTPRTRARGAGARTRRALSAPAARRRRTAFRRGRRGPGRPMTAALPPPGWPLADWSRIVTHRPHRWHVQEAGAGPTLMFIHGAAGATP
jgi:hypothetical protein